MKIILVAILAMAVLVSNVSALGGWYLLMCYLYTSHLMSVSILTTTKVVHLITYISGSFIRYRGLQVGKCISLISFE